MTHSLKREQIDSVKKKGKSPLGSTQTHLRIAEIRDNIIVLKNGGLRAIFKTSSMNFNLKSEAEQNSIIYSYQSFLNTIEFPIQIVVRSRKLDIDHYIDSLKKLGEQQKNGLLKKQTFEYAQYIQKLIEYANIMEKEFFVVVPYDPYRAAKMNLLEKFLSWIKPQDNAVKIRQRHNEHEELRKGMAQRINIVKSALEQCGLKVEQLTTQKLIELFYKIYNPDSSRLEKVEDAQKFDMVADEKSEG